MLRLAFDEKNIKANTILFDNWYAASALVHEPQEVIGLG
jgi:hypothetical protein